MDLKERYIYAVVSKLPEKQREEIKKEIRILIDDMMESAEGENEQIKLEKVLLELGEPSILADKYREQTRFLIGPKYFNDYIFTLKVVMIIVLIGCSISVIVGIFFEDDLTKLLTGYIPLLISAAVHTFTWVTLIFALFEYKKVDLKDEGKFSLKNLPPVPNKKAVISRGETIFGIIFATAFIVLFYSELFAVYIPKGDEGFAVIPIFEYNAIRYLKLIVVILSLLNITKEVLKLVFGRWNLKLSVIYTILTVVSTVIFVIVFSNPDIWNLNLITDITNTLDVKKPNLSFDYRRIINWVVGIGVFGCIIDITVALYKGIKYNEVK